LRIWQSNRILESAVLKPQKSTVRSLTPATQLIRLQVKLSREGFQFTAENGEIRVIQQEREFEKTKEGVFLKFKNPQKSYDALKSG
jgi:hypothetical protein